jgi:lipoprotein LprG
MSPAAPHTPSRDQLPGPRPTSPRGRSRRLLSLLTAVGLLTGLAACSKDEPDPATLPNGTTLVSESATAMANVETSHIVLELDPPVGGLPISLAEGDLTRDGDAKGAIQLLQSGQLIEVEFIILGDADDYLKYPTGGWQRTTLITSFYDPSAILDPERGVAKLMETSTNARTTGQERIVGVDCWRIDVNIDRRTANTLVPGVPDGLTGTVWVDKATKHMIRAVVNAPASGASPASTITLTLTNFNAPVTVSAP